MKLTKKQKILLDFVAEFSKEHDYSPTFREIMYALGYKSVSTVAKHIDNLVMLGYIIKREGEARSLEVTYGGSTADVPWWVRLEQEIAVREASSVDGVSAREADILRQALEIVRK
jgi:repressor LexA